MVELKPPHPSDISADRDSTAYLGAGEGGAERARILLDIGNGTVWEYTWRVARLLVDLVRRHIPWLSPQQSRQLLAPLKPRQDILRLYWVPRWHGGTFAKQATGPLAQENRVYGFNLQAGVSGLSMRLPAILPVLMIQQPSRTVLCTECFADKAYHFDRHVITPDKKPVARQRSHASFN